MCGIVAYFGSKPAWPFLSVALPRLDYRGYDGAGCALIGEGLPPLICKVEGRIENLIAKLASNNFYSCVGFAHTRWATHGNTAEINSHPHLSNDQNLIGVHNGTIENYLILKKQLEKSGYIFYSQTDTEVLINFIDWICKEKNLDLVSALQIALLEIVGTCALVVYSQSEKKLVAVNKGGHLCAGTNGADVFIASDKVAFAGYSEDYFEIGDGQFLIMEKGKEWEFLSPDLEKVRPFLEKINVDIRELELGDFPNFTLKEIYSQPDVIRGALAGRVDYQKGEFCFGGLDSYWPQIKSADSLTIVACGTSYHAGLLGKRWLEKLAGLSVKVEDASEFQSSVIRPGDLVLGISQSGTTADTLAALKAAKDKGAIIFGICNVVESPLARLTHAGIYTRAGVENGVASTKAFTAQALALLLFALKLSKDKKIISGSELTEIINQLEGLPEKMEQALAVDCVIESLAKKFEKHNNYFYLGRDFNFPVALEGALKLKELAYVFVEGMSSGGLKHGPLALVDKHLPIVAIATASETYGKTLNNLSEIKARGGILIIVVNEGDDQATKLANELIAVPQIHEVLSPIVNIIPLQLFAYHSAQIRGCNVDRPRNLAKSVTVG